MAASLFLFFFELSTIPVLLIAFRTRQKLRYLAEALVLLLLLFVGASGGWAGFSAVCISLPLTGSVMILFNRSKPPILAM